MQQDLFSIAAPEDVERIERKGLDLSLYRQWINTPEADRLFDRLLGGIDWHQSTISLYGQPLLIPRMNAWYADTDCQYGYSGLKLKHHPWMPELKEVRDQLKDRLGLSFNSVLVNLYRDGKDSVDWHADDEVELGVNPVIASISLGQERKFVLQPKKPSAERLSLVLPHGSLLVMQGPTQHGWQHSLPKSRRMMGPRINLTFRTVMLGK